jgi:outer membrane lipoprotein LolB
LVAGALLLALGACSALPGATSADAASSATLAPWTGRLALRVDALGDSPARQASLRFELRGAALAGSLLLSSPLGTTVAAARWAPQQVMLQVPDRPPQSFENLESLTRELLGESLPVAALFDWLDGRPMASRAHTPFGPLPDGSQGFEQLGWRVDTSRRSQQALQLVRTAPPRIDLRVRLDDPAA